MAKLNKSFQQNREVNISEVIGLLEAVINHDFQIGNNCHRTVKIISGVSHSTESQIIAKLGEMATDPDSTQSFVKNAVTLAIFSVIASIVSQ